MPLDYVAEKLGSAIQELHRVGRNHPEQRRELMAPMYYAVVAYLGLHSMLAKANDHSLASRLLEATTEELDAWVPLVRREGQVAWSCWGGSELSGTAV